MRSKYRVVNSFLRDSDNKIPWKYLIGGYYEHYKVCIQLEGEDGDLDDVQQVTYTLHPSFPNPDRECKNRNTKFAITIWTYGDFEMSAIVFLKNGRTEFLTHGVTLDLPEDDEEYAEALS